MAANPEPCDIVSLEECHGAVAECDAHRIDRFVSMDFLELQAGMVRVLAKEPICLARSLPDGFGKLTICGPEARCRAGVHRLSGSRSVVWPAVPAARASAANFVSVPWVPSK